MAYWSGWCAAVAIVFAALVPFIQRLRAGKRAPPGSSPIKIHVMLGLTTSALAFGHTLVVIPALGSPAAIGAGVFALLSGGAAFFFLVAHAGLGLQLRDPKLKDRAKKRRAHTTTAVLIALAVTVHAVMLERAGR